MNKREIGTAYERKAVTFLIEQGYEILEMNYRCRLGEIDIIARQDEYLVFIEVKYRHNEQFGGAKAAVDYKKQKTISKVAAFYMMKNQILDNVPCRFDVVAILDDRIQVLKNAFEYRG